MLASTAYFPPISFFAQAVKHGKLTLEAHEHFVKQTYRNRMRIVSANGVLDLIIPVVREQGSKTPIKNVGISHEESWHKQHWHAIVSAYNSTPFFDYYKDEFEFLFDGSITNLWDFNLAIIKNVKRVLNLQFEIFETAEYEKYAENDFRSVISPKNKEQQEMPPYYQIFEEKHGFISDMSVLDLISNIGPEAQLYIKSLGEGG